MAKKPMKRFEHIEVIYDEGRWRLLRELRLSTIDLMEKLDRFNISSVVYGSIARGDVNEKSDIDIFVFNPPSSFILETSLERANVSIQRRIIVQATPTYGIKGVLEVDERRSISFPLVKLRSIERGLYRFGGEIDLPLLRNDVRVCGVDKRLMLIEPTLRGHLESSVVGNEVTVANKLNIPLNVVQNRVRILLRRDEVGRTGVFLEEELTSEETFEMALKRLKDHIPAVRRRVKHSEFS